MNKRLFWRLFVILSLGVVTFFSLLHSAAILSNEKMSYIHKAHQQQILAWGDVAKEFIEQGQLKELDDWLTELSVKENTWVSVVQSKVQVVAGDALTERFWSGHRIGRDVSWKIHLEFPDNPIMEVKLLPTDKRFLIILPDRMRPGSYQSFAFWIYRAVIPFLALFVLTLYLYRQIMTPLKHLYKATSAFSQGDYQARVKVQRDDEFGQVAKTFNTMAERTASLIEHNSNLIADMSHEMRTPIARIEMALDCAENNIDTEQMLNKINANAKQMRQLCEDTLTLAWIENEQPDLRSEAVDLVTLMEVLVEDALFEFNNIKINFTAPTTVQIYQSNQRALACALENIIRNGLRYTPPGKSLDITLTQQQDQVCIAIVDSGPGLDEQHCEKIFLPFFKANNQQTARKGFGVGLALAKRHIEAVNGFISVFNHQLGGLAFNIFLPVGTLDKGVPK